MYRPSLLIFLFYCSFALVAEETLVNSPCIGNVLIAPYSLANQFAGNPIEITQECYKDKIDNYESLVFGHQIHAECYIEESFMYFSLNGTKYSRCGSCVELTGPRLQAYSCMITGSFVVSNTKGVPNEMENGFKTSNIPSTSMFSGKLSLLVSSTVFNEVIPSEMTDSLYYYEVALREATCNYNVLPQLILTNKTNAIIINAGEIIFGFGRANDLKIPNDDSSFTISNTKELRATNIFDSITYWDSISIAEESFQKVQTASSRFSSPTITSHCVQLPSKNVFNSVEDQPNTQLHWEMKVGTTQEEMEIVTSVGTKTIGDNAQLIIQFNYPVPIQWKTMIKHFALVVNSTQEIDLKSGRVYFKQGSIDQDNCNSFRYIIQNKTLSSGSYKYSFNIHSSFVTSSCNGYANGIELIVSAPKGTIIQYYQSYFESQTTPIVNTTSFCSSNSFSCFNYQCTVAEDVFRRNNNSTIIYESSSCVPYCGSCIVGYICSDDGKCSKNSRK